MTERGLDQDLGSELRRLPTPAPSAELLARVRRRGHLELAAREDERFNRQVMGFLLLFSWTLTVAGVALVRLLTGGGGSLAGFAFGGGASPWSLAYFAGSWIAGAALLAVVAFGARRERTLA